MGPHPPYGGSPGVGQRDMQKGLYTWTEIDYAIDHYCTFYLAIVRYTIVSPSSSHVFRVYARCILVCEQSNQLAPSSFVRSLARSRHIVVPNASISFPSISFNLALYYNLFNVHQFFFFFHFFFLHLATQYRIFCSATNFRHLFAWLSVAMRSTNFQFFPVEKGNPRTIGCNANNI